MRTNPYLASSPKKRRHAKKSGGSIPALTDTYTTPAYIKTIFRDSQVGPGNIDLGIAKTLQSDHPEVVMFGRRCLGNAEGLYAKAKELADAGDDVRAVKVGRDQRC